MLKKSPAADVLSAQGLVSDIEREILTQPYHDEFNAEAIGRLLVVVLDDLWRENHDPACNRDGAQDAADGFNVQAVAH